MLSRLSVWWIICHWKNTYKINLHLNAAAIRTSTHIARTYTYTYINTHLQRHRHKEILSASIMLVPMFLLSLLPLNTHTDAHKQLAANYSLINYFTCCPLWWLLWPFPPKHFLHSASAIPPSWRLLAPNVSTALPEKPAPTIDQAKDWDQLKVFYPALKVDRSWRARLSKCHFNSKFMNA